MSAHTDYMYMFSIDKKRQNQTLVSDRVGQLKVP